MEGGEADGGTATADAVWLISRAAALALNRTCAGVRVHHLTVRSCGVLLALGDLKVTTHQVLRELFDIDKNAMVGLVDDLEQRGWVRRSRSATDRRVHHLSLTDRGQEFVYGELVDLVRELDSTITSPLGDTDRERLCATLGRAIGSRLGRHDDDTGGIS